MTNQAFNIFVVEDDEWYRKLLVHTLSLNPDNNVRSFANGKSMLKNLKEKPHLVTLDFRLPDFDGMDLFDKIKSESPKTEIVVISEQQDIETAITLLKKGAYDYLTKTDDIRDRLVHVLNRFSKNRALENKVESLQEEVEKRYDLQTNLIGQSSGINKVMRLMEKATQTNITVMITGETGTGKEVVAKSIHYNSPQKKNSFVPVNMSAIPKDLVESELFGHEKGSFTGASGKHIGKFEQANGGTLFLDEIGEMDISLQAKLLRALQEKEISRVGGTRPVKVDCRVIVATHRNLLQEVKAGNFREDLYYRLFGLPIELPPLRERDKDILLLARHFVESFAKENKQSPKTLSKDALQKLMNYAYPGNIRELKSMVELAIVMSDTNEITAEDILFSQEDVIPEIINSEMSMKEYELRIIHLFLKKYNNDIKLVADKLQIGQSTIYRLLKNEK